MTPRRERLALAATLLVAAALFALGLGWGLPAATAWDFDEILPREVIKAMGKGVARGWPVKYPPLQFFVLEPLYRAALWIQQLAAPALDAKAVYAILFYLSRSVSLVMGVGTVLWTYLAARRMVGPRAALLGTSVLVFCVPMVFYAKLGNLDVPYLFWLALSFLLLLRLLEHQRRIDYLLVAVTAAAAVATKDQAYGVYLLTPFVLLPALARRRRDEGRSAPAIGILLDSRPWIALAGGAVAFALFNGMAAGPAGFLAHFQKITGGYSEHYRFFPPTLEGHWHNLELTARNVRFSFGWPLLAACAAGLALAARMPTAERPRHLALPIVMAVSYYVTFVSVILYQYDRYFLPWAVLLAPFGGLALARLAAWRPGGGRWGAVAVGVVLAYSGARALTIDLHMLRDARYGAEEWLAARASGDRVLGIGPTPMLPRVGRNLSWRAAVRYGAENLGRLNADWLVMNAVAQWEPGVDVLHEALLAGRVSGFEHVTRIERPLPFDLLDREGITSSLYFVNRPIDIFRRRGPVAPGGAAFDAEEPERVEE